MTTKRAKVSILLAGEEFFGWDEYSIESDMLSPSDAFHLSVPNASGEWTDRLLEMVDQPFKLFLDGKKQMVGAIDEVSFSTDSNDVRAELTGRDPMGQLVDCSCTPKTYQKITLKTLAESIASDYISSWSTSSGVSLATQNVVKVDPGESIYDVLKRTARKDLVIFWCDADGNGVIGKPDYSTAPVHLLRCRMGAGFSDGNNIVSSRVTRSRRERFSTITVYGHGSNSSSIYGKTARAKCSATDSEISKRSLILVDGDAKSTSQARIRAEREVADRKMRALEVEITARGFYGEPTSGSASLYQVNQMVDLIDEPSGLDGNFWISRRRFVCDAQGQKTELTLHLAKLWLAE